MKLLIAFILVGGTLLASNETQGTYRFQPCDSWWYSSAANGHTCSFVGLSQTFVTARALEERDRKIADLERKLEDLEARLDKADSDR